MADGAAADGHLLPVPLPTRGPLAALNRRVSELQNTGRFAEALAAADAYEAVAAAVGDELSIRFLWQSRMYVHQNQGHHEEALAAGHELLRRQRAAADIVGEAKALADLAWSLVVTNQTVDAMRYLARSGMLLGRAEPRGERYLSALTSYSTTAWVAELYEIANEGYERVARICPPNGLPDADSPHDIMHVEVLLRWGIRLAQLDERGAARSKLRRAAELTQRWRDGYPHRDGMYYRAMSYRALALAKLDESDEAISLAEAAVLPLRGQQMHEEARLAHVAFGIALSARGDLAAAHRELLAAHQLLTPDAYADDRLIIAHERAALAALTAADDSSQAFLDAIGEQARQLWQLRLQRVAMLRQATEREKLEDEYARTETRLMHDPLTGLGNRVRFDQLMAAADAGQLPHPTTLLLIDIDNFKAINDTYSHSTGDQLLCVIGGILRAHCRSAEDVAVRYAGDEFTVFLHADLPAALEIAHRLGEAVRAADQLPDGVRASISIGAATLQPGMTATELFQCADQHLYRAKRAGRDRVAA